jgi:hypothetical protein
MLERQIGHCLTWCGVGDLLTYSELGFKEVNCFSVLTVEDALIKQGVHITAGPWF